MATVINLGWHHIGETVQATRNGSRRQVDHIYTNMAAVLKVYKITEPGEIDSDHACVVVEQEEYSQVSKINRPSREF
jgi:endonuclease/exonuclease/phosphatase family metal-dependent hydrolase